MRFRVEQGALAELRRLAELERAAARQRDALIVALIRRLVRRDREGDAA